MPGTTARTGTTGVREGGRGRSRSVATPPKQPIWLNDGGAGGTHQEWASGKLPKRRRSGPHTAARKIASRAARVGRQTARDPGFSDQLQLLGLAQVAWNDACCLARSCEPLDQSNGFCFRPKWTSRPPDPTFSWIPGPKKLDIQQNFPVGRSATPAPPWRSTRTAVAPDPYGSDTPHPRTGRHPTRRRAPADARHPLALPPPPPPKVPASVVGGGPGARAR